MMVLDGHVQGDGSERLFSPMVEGQQDVEIYEPVRVLPAEVLFPWCPREVDEFYKYQLKVRLC